MSKDELHLAASGQKHAFIRDGALILYFDKAETPFVARFDLDSLAQANFEVTDKKDGLFHLTLRDYSGEAQIIGQFSSKNDAHQALYLILQALLEQPTGTMIVEKQTCGVGCVLLKIIKWLFILFMVLLALYGIARLPVIPNKNYQSQPVAQSGGNPTPELPQGEAIDADEMLGDSDIAPSTPPAQ